MSQTHHRKPKHLAFSLNCDTRSSAPLTRASKCDSGVFNAIGGDADQPGQIGVTAARARHCGPVAELTDCVNGPNQSPRVPDTFRRCGKSGKTGAGSYPAGAICTLGATQARSNDPRPRLHAVRVRGGKRANQAASGQPHRAAISIAAAWWRDNQAQAVTRVRFCSRRAAPERSGRGLLDLADASQRFPPPRSGSLGRGGVFSPEN